MSLTPSGRPGAGRSARWPVQPATRLARRQHQPAVHTQHPHRTAAARPAALRTHARVRSRRL